MVNFWGSKTLTAHVTEVEDVFEDALSELPEGISPHVKEGKSEDEETGEKAAISEETANSTKKAAASQEEKEDMSTLFNSTSSTSKNQALVNLKKRRRPATNLMTSPRRRSHQGPCGSPLERLSKVSDAKLSTTLPMRRRRQLLPLSSFNNVLHPSESPAAADKMSSPFSFTDYEKHRTTRHQEKVIMEEVKVGRQKVMQFTFLKRDILMSIQYHPNLRCRSWVCSTRTSQRSRGVSRLRRWRRGGARR